MSSITKLEDKAKKIRLMTVQMAHEGPSAHIGSALSCVDILTALYFRIMNKDDRLTLSKGHGCMSYYATLNEKKILTKKIISSYAKNGSILAEHPLACKISAIENATGSLGHGLSVSIGAALGKKISNKPGREFVLLSDGECNEGSTWEGALVANNLQLNNIITIIDYNKMQASGFRDRTSLHNKWKYFGWDVLEIDGHNIKDIITAMNDTKNACLSPSVIIAHTIKGKGISFMENNLEWHYRSPNKKEYLKACEEIKNA